MDKDMTSPRAERAEKGVDKGTKIGNRYWALRIAIRTSVTV